MDTDFNNFWRAYAPDETRFPHRRAATYRLWCQRSEMARRKHKGDTRPRAVIWNEVKKEMEAGQVLGKCYASAGQLGNDGDI